MRRDIKNISQCIQIVFFWTAGTSAENEGLALQIVESREDVQLLKESEYSCAVTPQIRQTGNRLSGNAGTAYASLLA